MASPPHPAQSRDCYHQLRRLLVHAQIGPGTRLIESEWAKRLKVHRGSLREALSMLAHEGLLRRGEKGGYFVPLYEQRDLDEIWAVRRIIETGAIRLLSERSPQEIDLSELDASVDAMEQMLSSGYEMGFIEADRRFHQVLVELSGNERLLGLYNRAPLPLMPSPFLNADALYAANVRTVREHREIARLISTGQAEAAIEKLEEHLQQHRPSAVH